MALSQQATNNSPRSTCSYYNLTTPDGDALFPTSEDVLESCMSGTLETVTNTRTGLEYTH